MAEQWSSRHPAEQLLRVGRITDVARSIVQGSLLPAGRFEAHEFGSGQHSSASAGCLLVRLSAIKELPDDLIWPIADRVINIILPDGGVRGHDAYREAGDTTWAESQILLGLSARPNLIASEIARTRALATRLIRMQDSGGGWSLRKGDQPKVIFAFYPALALTRLYGRSIRRDAEIRHSLIATARHLAELLDSISLGIEEQILAVFAYECIAGVVCSESLTRLEEHRRIALSACWQPGSGLRLSDRTMAVHTQPVWHSIMWRPLFYLCVRKWLAPLNPAAVLLGAELIQTFDRSLLAWPGPTGMISRGTGSSWASALALRAPIAR